MIRVTFTTSAKGTWAHEMTINHGWVTVLRKCGVPIVGRIAVSGVERGHLCININPASTMFVFMEGADDDLRSEQFKRTHSGPGYIVEMSGVHLEKEEEL